jgi:menaquinol-cytochrome c reductase cytochrome b/c subunit
VDARQKEQYLREYQLLKQQGKPFFPYAVLKDSVMAVITLLVIIAMALFLGAELGPKADPTTTTYVPRPEWYFFFLFELLRVIKPPELVFMATVGIPTICLILLILLPFIDRGPERHPFRRPVATLAGVTTIAAMAYLTVLGALATSSSLEEGKQAVATNGCLACHRIGENGNTGIGPDLTHVGARLPKQAIVRTLVNPTPPMPSYQALQDEEPDEFDDMVDFLASLK